MIEAKYENFNSAITGTINAAEKLNTHVSSIEEQIAILCDSEVFDGPLSDRCMTIKNTLLANMSDLINNLQAVSRALAFIERNYMTSDSDTSNDISSVGGVN